ncbi:MAG TPA: hypothetical protein VL943_14325, partial [Niabella sp.]|nr:hypothetical protein [Niabella sp.]
MKKIANPLPVGILLLLLACQNQETAQGPAETPTAEAKTRVNIVLTDVDIKIGDAHFDKSLNDAADLVNIDSS